MLMCAYRVASGYLFGVRSTLSLGYIGSGEDLLFVIISTTAFPV